MRAFSRKPRAPSENVGDYMQKKRAPLSYQALGFKVTASKMVGKEISLFKLPRLW